MADRLASEGRAVTFRQDPNNIKGGTSVAGRRTADATVNGKTVEFKEMSGATNLDRSLESHIRSGLGQSPRVMVDATNQRGMTLERPTKFWQILVRESTMEAYRNMLIGFALRGMDFQ
jgi:hypothetical protein